MTFVIKVEEIRCLLMEVTSHQQSDEFVVSNLASVTQFAVSG